MLIKNAPLRVPVKLGLDAGTSEVSHRLIALGLRPGVEMQLLSKTAGGGRMIAVGNSRVALGLQLCRELQVDAL